MFLSHVGGRTWPQLRRLEVDHFRNSYIQDLKSAWTSIYFYFHSLCFTQTHYCFSLPLSNDAVSTFYPPSRCRGRWLEAREMVVGHAVPASFFGESAWKAVFLLLTLTPTRAPPTSRPCTRCLVPATLPSFLPGFPLTSGSTRWLLSATRLWLGLETLSMAVLLMFSLSNNRYISGFLSIANLRRGCLEFWVVGPAHRPVETWNL